MGLITGILKRLFKLILYFTIFVVAVVLIPNLPPHTKFTSIKHEATLPRIGPLAPNGDLNNAEKLYLNKVEGPEAFQLHNGEVYTSLATGVIVKISPGGHVTYVTKIGSPCTGLVQEHICGRPLGFQIDEKNNLLYVADAYHGIWKVDLKNGKKTLLVSPRVEIGDRKPMLFNHVALDKKGNLFWTDSSSDLHLKDGAIIMLLNPSGRLFQYNAAKNESKLLLDDLWFANGVVVSPDDQFVVVAETCGYRLLKYYLSGPNKGKSEVFVAGLPGVPDNIRALPDGSGFLVSLYTVFDEENPLILRSLSETPVLRKFLARLQRLIEIPFEYLNQHYPHVLLEEIVYHIGHFKSMTALAPKSSGLLQFDWNGNIVASYYNTDGSMPHISDAIVFNDKLYMGRPHQQNYIASVPVPPLLKKAFAKVTPKSPKVEAKEAPEVKVEKAQEKKTPQSATQPPTPKPVESKPPPTTPKPQTKPSTPKPETKPQPKPEVKITTPKPEVKTTTPKAEVKTTTPKVEVKTTTPKAEVKTTTPKVEVKTTTPKPEAKTTTPKTEPKPKPEIKPPTPKPSETKPETKAKPAATEQKSNNGPKVQKASAPKAEKPSKSGKPVPEPIPIKEEIPVDTVKPNKDTLKVIKKGGPAEIPNPHL